MDIISVVGADTARLTDFAQIAIGAGSMFLAGAALLTSWATARRQNALTAATTRAYVVPMEMTGFSGEGFAVGNWLRSSHKLKCLGNTPAFNVRCTVVIDTVTGRGAAPAVEPDLPATGVPLTPATSPRF